RNTLAGAVAGHHVGLLEVIEGVHQEKSAKYSPSRQQRHGIRPSAQGRFALDSTRELAFVRVIGPYGAARAPYDNRLPFSCAFGRNFGPFPYRNARHVYLPRSQALIWASQKTSKQQTGLRDGRWALGFRPWALGEAKSLEPRA